MPHDGHARGGGEESMSYFDDEPWLLGFSIAVLFWVGVLALAGWSVVRLIGWAL